MDSLKEILIFVCAILWALFSLLLKNRKEEKRPTLNNNKQNVEPEEVVQQNPKRSIKKVANKDASQPFSYETMSERDFEAEFAKNVENKESFFDEETHNKQMPSLNFDNEEFYKGIVYSEILKKKYC